MMSVSPTKAARAALSLVMVFAFGQVACAETARETWIDRRLSRTGSETGRIDTNA